MLFSRFSTSSKLKRFASSATRALSEKPILPTEADLLRGKEARSFVDYKRVTCKAGDGGNGMVSFARFYGVPFGGPDGGDGGNGGHIIFKADLNTKDLSHLPRVARAKNGIQGLPKGHHGKSAEHFVIKVPIRTSFKNADDDQIVCSLDAAGSIFLAARGGAGGHGNHFYLTNEVRKPIKAEMGGCGEQISYDIEMRVMAIAGLVGFPNVGKSSLLRAISRAKPKVASYPFTTLKPHVGVVHYEDYVQVPVADIPGLIEGSCRNEGLGFNFLRHISRCYCLFYVLDCTLSEPKKQFEILRRELEIFEEGLSLKPSAVIINKVDLFSNTFNKSAMQSDFAPYKIFFISAKQKLGIMELLMHLRQEYNAYSETVNCENDEDQK